MPFTPRTESRARIRAQCERSNRQDSDSANKRTTNDLLLVACIASTDAICEILLPMSHIERFVCICVCAVHDRKPCRMAEQIEIPFTGGDQLTQ